MWVTAWECGSLVTNYPRAASLLGSGFKAHLFTDFSKFKGIRLNFGGHGGVNYEMLILYFRSILPFKMTLLKAVQFVVIFKGMLLEHYLIMES